MKHAAKKTNRFNRSLPALVAVGGSLATLPAAALELGDLTVHSRLGQPLRASIAYALAPNEILSNHCIAMRPGQSLSGLPNVAPATLSVANGVIMLVGEKPVREPMVSAHIVVNCPYAPHISREYMLFVDPASPAYEQVVVRQPAESVTAFESPAAATQTPATVRPVPTRRTTPAVTKDIGQSSRYQVQPGDSLSKIVQRIENRPAGLWPAVNAVFAANPDAFIDNDPNKLKAGSWLTIPSFDGTAPVVTDDVSTTSAAAAPTEPVAPAATAIEAVAVATAIDDSTADLQPGDIAVSDNPFVESETPIETTVIPDTRLDGPVTTSSSPNVPVATIVPRVPETTSNSWLYWLAGSGVAVILALLLFGRRLRHRFGTEPTDAVIPDSTPQRRRTDTDTENVEAIGVDFDLSDDSPTDENLTLDADLIIGTGLGQGTEMDVAQDFGFAAPMEQDVDLPFEPDASGTTQPNPLIDPEKTDMLPPLRTDEHSILDSEVLPNDDDYDMSVIVDATKMPQADDVTERDLKAVAVHADDETSVTDSYTITKEVDYEILEQDYEDEMTATQALNAEIARAAAELTARIENDDDSDETAALPLATVTELDVTAQMRAQNDDISDLDDTGINEAITVNAAADDRTAEMPVTEKEDDTIEMQVESGKVG